MYLCCDLYFNTGFAMNHFYLVVQIDYTINRLIFGCSMEKIFCLKENYYSDMEEMKGR